MTDDDRDDWRALRPLQPVDLAPRPEQGSACRADHAALAKILEATREEMRAAVAQGLRDAVADPAVWSAAVAAIQAQAQNQAGGWLLGGLKTALSKLMWIVVIGVGVYLLGGWTGLVALLKGGHQ